MLNPFFQFREKKKAKIIVPYLKLQHLRDRHAMAPEYNVAPSSLPHYKRHFTFDYDNPY